MPGYATTADLIGRFGAQELVELTDESEGGLVTAELLKLAAAGSDLDDYTEEEQEAVAACLATLEEALADAGSEIDPYLTGRYTLPLSSVPRVLLTHACNMTRYHLFADRVTEVVEVRYKAALTFLKDVSAGRASLGLDVEGAAVATESTGGIIRSDVTPGHPDIFERY
jgi:phage gp36-like protein